MDSAARQQVADLQRDNGILKRAVAIQNARLQVCISTRPPIANCRARLEGMSGIGRASHLALVFTLLPGRADHGVEVQC